MKDFAKKVAVAVTVAILIVIIFSLIILGFKYIAPHFIPFLIAYLLAIILEPINQLLLKKGKIKRGLSVFITYVLFLGLFLLLIYFIIAKITTQMIDLIKYIQENIPNIEAWILNTYDEFQSFLTYLPDEFATQINDSLNSIIQKLASVDLLSNIGNYALDISTAIPNLFILAIILFVSLYLFSLYLPGIHNQFYSYFTESTKDIVNTVLTDLKNATVGFLRGQIILSSLTYLISFIGLSILGVKYSYAIALLVVIVDLLPILGTGSTLGPWAIISILQGNYVLAVGLIVLFIVLIVVRKAIEPKILGERIGLGPLTTLISIWVGFKVMGILGVFIGPLLIILIKALVNAGVITYRLKL